MKVKSDKECLESNICSKHVKGIKDVDIVQMTEVSLPLYFANIGYEHCWEIPCSNGFKTIFLDKETLNNEELCLEILGGEFM